MLEVILWNDKLPPQHQQRKRATSKRGIFRRILFLALWVPSSYKPTSAEMKIRCCWENRFNNDVKTKPLKWTHAECVIGQPRFRSLVCICLLTAVLSLQWICFPFSHQLPMGVVACDYGRSFPFHITNPNAKGWCSGVISHLQIISNN